MDGSGTISGPSFSIVTPEAVELDLDTAGLASRMLAILFDLVCLMFVLYAVGFAVAFATIDGNETVAAVFAVVMVFALLIGWPIAWEVGTKGRSLGKFVFGLRVVTVDGAPIRFRHAAIRGLVGLVEIIFFLGMLAAGVALASRRFQRLGDHLAGTVVVRERGAGAERGFAHRFVPYPGWEAWAARLDATRLTEDDYRIVRSFLLRSRSLPPEARERLGHQILARVLPRTGQEHLATGFGGWPVDVPLTAVAAAYQRRFDGVLVG